METLVFDINLFVFLLVYTLMIVAFGAIGYGYKRDIRTVLIFQIVIAGLMVLFVEIVMQATSVLLT